MRRACGSLPWGYKPLIISTIVDYPIPMYGQVGYKPLIISTIVDTL